MTNVKEMSPQQKIEIAKGLSVLLADSYTLYLKTHNFHWNVVGPMFQTLHLMFEQHYTELAPVSYTHLFGMLFRAPRFGLRARLFGPGELERSPETLRVCWDSPSSLGSAGLRR